LKQGTSKNKWAILGLIVGVLLIVSAAAYYVLDYAAEEPIEWEVTLVGINGEQRVLSYKEIRSLPCQDARGGFLTSAGVKYGPYDVRGVLLQDLCNLVGGIANNSGVAVSAPDGYSMVFGHDQIYSADFVTYDPITLHEMPHENQMVLLTYEWNGKAIPHNDGGPLRLVIVSSEALLTEGHNWVRWVNKIEVVSLE
jgi:DMSO/TMAO reductase YedYZ molybdopterin-dependent catalytic subunit